MFFLPSFSDFCRCAALCETENSVTHDPVAVRDADDARWPTTLNALVGFYTVRVLPTVLWWWGIAAKVERRCGVWSPKHWAALGQRTLRRHPSPGSLIHFSFSFFSFLFFSFLFFSFFSFLFFSFLSFVEWMFKLRIEWCWQVSFQTENVITPTCDLKFGELETEAVLVLIHEHYCLNL